jgi:restriction endonuclease S subunit
VHHQLKGDTLVVQLKDVDYQTVSFSTELTKVNGMPISNKYTLDQNDVLFIAKGSNNLALLAPNRSTRCVASSIFFVLRCDTTKILPGYLVWYINQPEAQQYFASNKEGTYTPNIGKQVLLDLDVPVVPLDIQAKIIQANTLLQKEKALLKEITTKRNLLITEKLNSLIQ